MFGLQAELSSGEEETVADDATVVFDTLVQDESPYLSYGTATGEITIDALGVYYISWWVATSAVVGQTSITMELQLNGVSLSGASTNVIIGQLAGNAVVPVATTGSVLELVNISGGAVTIPDIAVQGGFSIIHVNVPV
jgi:hypothetical protein